MKLKYALFCLFPFFVRCQVSPHVITFFVKPLPKAPAPAIKKALQEQKQMMGSEKLLQPIMSQVLNLPFLHAGLYASYAGTITHSDTDGQILFERKSPDPKLRVLITDSIEPVPIDPFFQKTLYGFVIDPEANAQQYLFERLQDPETEAYFWQASAIPVDRDVRIPYDTIIVYADPQHIIVPLGPTATKRSENFVLPDFYITEGYNSANNALRFLKIRHFFAPVAFDYTFLPEAYQKKISA